ncbi:MAG: TolC family protein [Planctomycetes bacterium]|nr:TolC family protein [Planctomycetota bacterium]
MTAYPLCRPRGTLARRCVRLLALVALSALPLGAEDAQPPAPTAAPAAPVTAPPVAPGAPAAPERPDRATLRLSAREAVEFALANNLDVQISRIGPEIGHWDIVSAMGIFDPIGFYNYTAGKDVRATGSELSGAEILNNQSHQFDIGVKGQLFQGLKYTVDYQGQRSYSNSEFASLNPAWTTSIGFGLTQSILRGGGTKYVMAPIRIARKGKAAAHDQFEIDLTTSVFNVLTAYWNLVFAINDRAVKEKSLRLAQRLLEVNRNKVRVGSMAPIEELSAEASVAAQQEGILVAETAIENAADRLKSLIFPVRRNLDEWDVTLVPADEPLFMAYPTEVESSIITAIGRRPELARLLKLADQQELVLVQAQNEQLPLLDVSWSFRYNGLAEGMQESYRQTMSTDYKTWQIGAVLEYPFGSRTARGREKRASAEHRRIILQTKSAEQQIVVEVREAVRELATVAKRIEANTVAGQLARKQLEAEEKRLELGLSTSHQVLQIQKDVAQAEENAAKATIDYTMAVYKHQKATGTLLAALHIEPR